MIRRTLRRFWAWLGDYDFILPGEMTWPSTESFTSGIRLDSEFGGRETHFLENTDRHIHGVHPATACAAEYCTIHNRSDHHMRSWPQNWRGDRGIMERICDHGVGHPDPDEINPDTVHGCDGCCATFEELGMTGMQTRITAIDGMDGYTPDMLRVRKRTVFEVYRGNYDGTGERQTVWTLDRPDLCEVGDVVELRDDEDPDIVRYGRCVYVLEPKAQHLLVGGPFKHYVFNVLSEEPVS